MFLILIIFLNSIILSNSIRLVKLFCNISIGVLTLLRTFKCSVDSVSCFLFFDKTDLTFISPNAEKNESRLNVTMDDSPIFLKLKNKSSLDSFLGGGAKDVEEDVEAEVEVELV